MDVKEERPGNMTPGNMTPIEDTAVVRVGNGSLD